MLISLNVVISAGIRIQANVIGVFPVARAQPVEEGSESGHAGGNEGKVVLDTAARMCR